MSQTIMNKKLNVVCAAALLSLACSQDALAQNAASFAGRWSMDDCGTTSAMSNDVEPTAVAARGSSVQCTTDPFNRAKGAALFTVSRGGDGADATNLVVRDTNALSFANELAVSINVKPASTPEGALVTKGVTANGVTQKAFQFGIVRDAAGASFPRITIWVQPPAGGAAVPVTLTSPTQIASPVTKWIRLGASYKPSEGLIKLYVNGAEAGRLAESRAIADVSSGKVWVGGGMSATSTRGYLGAVDDLWLSNGACADLTGPTAIIPDREQVITRSSVVDDARTTNRGPWSFAYLMEQMVPADPANPQAAQLAAAAMVQKMFQSFLATADHNGKAIVPRAGAAAVESNSVLWPRIPGTSLPDLTAAPVTLLAIVNRTDLQDLTKRNGGEGRFVFQVDGGSGPFNIIFEYKLPASTDAEVRAWAAAWHKLGAIDPATNPGGFNAELEKLTNRFTARGARIEAADRVEAVNHSAISQIRTNEFIDSPWELREFVLAFDSVTKVTSLKPVGAKLSPFNSVPGSLNNTAALVNFVDANATAIGVERYEVPDAMLALASQNGSTWTFGTLPTAANEARHAELRQKFGVNSCNGCHSNPETRTAFTHVGSRTKNSTVALLSGFMTGNSGFGKAAAPASFQKVDMRDDVALLDPAKVPVLSMNDPLAGAARVNKFADLARRANTSFKLMSCAIQPAVASTAPVLRTASALKTTAAAPVAQAAPTSTANLTTTVSTPTLGASTLPAPIGRVH